MIPTGKLISPEKTLNPNRMPVSQKSSGLIDTSFILVLLTTIWNPLTGRSYARSTINLGDGSQVHVSQDNRLFNHLTVYNGDDGHYVLIDCALAESS